MSSHLDPVAPEDDVARGLRIDDDAASPSTWNRAASSIPKTSEPRLRSERTFSRKERSCEPAISCRLRTAASLWRRASSASSRSAASASSARLRSVMSSSVPSIAVGRPSGERSSPSFLSPQKSSPLRLRKRTSTLRRTSSSKRRWTSCGALLRVPEERGGRLGQEGAAVRVAEQADHGLVAVQEMAVDRGAVDRRGVVLEELAVELLAVAEGAADAAASAASASRPASAAASRPRLRASPAQPRAAADAQAAASQPASPAGRAKSTAAVRASPTPAEAPIQRRMPP